MDRFALLVARAGGRATANGYFTSLIPVRSPAGELLLDRDEHPGRGPPSNALANLRPAFQKLGDMGLDAIARRKYSHLPAINHVHTAGNSSGIVDGAALVLVGSREKGAALGLKPRPRVVPPPWWATEPTIMLTGRPRPAARRCAWPA